MKHSSSPQYRGLSRRNFLGQASCAAVGSSALFNTILNLSMTSRASAAIPSNEYKAMVCLFLAGGNDSFNMLSPLDNSEYNLYKNVRADLALDGSSPEKTPLPINAPTSGRTFGIHPGMTGIRDLYTSGELAFVSNVGTLVRPTTLSDYNSGSMLPKGLFSHSDQIQQWQTSVPNQRIGKGWGGRTADLLASLNDSTELSMNVSLGGLNVFQTGNMVVPYAISNGGAVTLDGYNGTSPVDVARTAAVNNQLDFDYANLFEKTFTNKTKHSKDAAGLFNSAVNNSSLGTSFPNSSLGKDLEMVAKTIAAHSTLGFRRQTFFVLAGGWDHHDETLENQAAMLPMVSQAVKAFRDALVNDLNMWDQVTLFQASDFGRTLTSNGKGSDHAWGGNYFVTGGGVEGGEVYGTYPTMDLAGSGIDTGRGRFIPQVSVDEFNAELGLWFGVDQSNLATVLPNIREFYPSNATAGPIGFLA